MLVAGRRRDHGKTGPPQIRLTIQDADVLILLLPYLRRNHPPVTMPGCTSHCYSVGRQVECTRTGHPRGYCARHCPECKEMKRKQKNRERMKKPRTKYSRPRAASICAEIWKEDEKAAREAEEEEEDEGAEQTRRKKAAATKKQAKAAAAAPTPTSFTAKPLLIRELISSNIVRAARTIPAPFRGVVG